MVQTREGNHIILYLEKTYGGGHNGTLATPTKMADAANANFLCAYVREDATAEMPWMDQKRKQFRALNGGAAGITILNEGIVYKDGKLPVYLQNSDLMRLAMSTAFAYELGDQNVSAGINYSAGAQDFRITVRGRPITADISLTANCANPTAIAAEINTKMLAAGVKGVEAYVDTNYVGLRGIPFTLSAPVDGTNALTALGWDTNLHDYTAATLGTVLSSLAIHWQDAIDDFEAYGCQVKEFELKVVSNDWAILDVTLWQTRSTNTDIDTFSTDVGFASHTTQVPLKWDGITITVDGAALDMTSFTLKWTNKIDEETQYINYLYRQSPVLITQEWSCEIEFKATPSAFYTDLFATAYDPMPIVIAFGFTNATETLTLANMYIEPESHNFNEMEGEAGIYKHKAKWVMGESATAAWS